jgi:hypothetical protein
MDDRRTLNTEKTETMSQAIVVRLVSILDRLTLNTEQGVMILLYKIFYKGKNNFISLGKFIFSLL